VANGGVWAIGPGKRQLYFGPYDLDKTTDGTPYPTTDGDIIIITTGSTVLGGSIGDGALAYSALDERVWNLLFYSTGSNNVAELSGKIPGITDPSKTLIDYEPITRASYFYYNKFMAFVAMPSSGTNTLKWWPLMWTFHNAGYLLNVNDA
jgi:hypothetical protein